LDPDSYLQKYGKERYLLQLKKGSAPLIKFLVDHFSMKDRINSFYEKIQIAEKIINLVGVNPKILEGSEHLRQLSEYLNLEEQLLRDRIKGKSSGKNMEESDFFLPAEKRLLQILLENHAVASQVLTKAKEDDFRGLKSEPAFKLIVENHKKGKRAVFPELFRAVEPNLSRCLSQMMLEQAEKGTEEEALDCLLSLRKILLESQLRILQKEIVRCERNGEKDKLSRLLSQKQTLTKQIVAM
jgi:DNA primase